MSKENSAVYSWFLALAGDPAARIPVSEADSWKIRIWYWQTLELLATPTVTHGGIASLIDAIDAATGFTAENPRLTAHPTDIPADEFFRSVAIPHQQLQQMKEMATRLTELVNNNPSMKLNEEIDPTNEVLIRLLKAFTHTE